MAKIGLAWENFVDAGALSSGSSLPSQSASNLSDPDLKRRWAAGTTATWLLVDFGQPRIINTVMLAGTNFTSSFIRRVRLSTVDSTGETGDAYDSGEASAGGEIDPKTGLFVHLTGEASGRFLRVDVEDATVSRLEAGRLFSGPLFQPRRNIDFGYSRGVIDPTDRRFTPGRSPRHLARATHRTMRFEFRFLTEDESRDLAETILEDIGLLGDLLVVFNPDSDRLARDSIWGQMQRLNDYSAPGFNRFRWSVDIMERL